MTDPIKAPVHTFGALLLIAALTACQAYGDGYNPINILCPGDFDSVTNECVIPTGGVD